MRITPILRAHGIGVGKKPVGNAQPGDVLDTKTFMNADGEQTGTMPNQGQKILVPGNSDIVIPAGYHDGTGKVSAVNFDASKLLSGTTVAGTAGTMINRGAYNITPGSSNKTIPPGYHSGAGVVYGDADLKPDNIRSGTNIFGVSGTVEPLPPGVLYLNGVQGIDWTEGYQVGSCSGSRVVFESNSIYVGAMGSNKRTLVTANPVNLSGYNLLYIVGKFDMYQGEAWIVVSTSKDESYDTYTKRICVYDTTNEDDNPWDVGHGSLDISSLSGSYYIRIHANAGRQYCSDHSVSINVFGVLLIRI